MAGPVGPVPRGEGGERGNVRQGGYNAALVQTIILGLIFFFLPGGFNAISSMAGGVGDPNIVATGNAALYACFAVFSLFAPVVVNIFGPRVTLFIGAIGYPLYILCLWTSGAHHWLPQSFVIIGSVILGICAALTWTAQGSLIMAYPSQAYKGSFFALFWILFNAGGVVTSFFISFLMNLGKAEAPAASDGTFIAFLAVMVVGCVCVLGLSRLDKVVRPDGHAVIVDQQPAVLPEIIGMAKLITNPSAFCLIPIFLYTNWCYPYQFNTYNSLLFNTPTQGLSNAFYWGAQMLAAWLLGLYLDATRFGSVKKRALVSLASIGIFVTATWVCGLIANYSYDLNNNKNHEIKFSDVSEYIPLLILYFFWGASDALVQCWCYWIMGQITDVPEELSRYSGFYKAFNSAGNTIGNALSANRSTPADPQIWINVILFLVSLPFAGITCSRLKGESVSVDGATDKLSGEA